MKAFVIGGGGREHALVAALVRSKRVDAVLCAPGNAGTGKVGRNLYRYRAIENLWENLDESDPNGNRDKLAGAFYVDSTFYHDPGSDTHCSGTSTSEPDASCDGIVPDALRDDVVTVLRRIGTLNNPIPGYSDNATVPPAANVSYKCIRLGEHLESIP